MKLKIVLIMALSFSQMVKASSLAEYCLEAKLVNITTLKEKSSLKCNISQKLTWEDFSALFDCKFTIDTGSVFSSADTIGIELDSSIAWVTYKLKGDEIGNFLAKGLQLKNVKKFQAIKIMFGSKVWAKDKFIVIEDEEGTYKLYLNAYEGVCK